MQTCFCENCGQYIRPDQVEICWLESGKPGSVCTDCKRIIYQSRINASAQSLKTFAKGLQLPLFVANST